MTLRRIGRVSSTRILCGIIITPSLHLNVMSKHCWVRGITTLRNVSAEEVGVHVSKAIVF